MRLLLMMGTALLISASAQATTLTGHFTTGSGLTAEELKSDQEWGQTFQIPASGAFTEADVDNVVLWLFRQNNQNNKTITASIRTSWNGAPLWESTIAANSVEKDSGADQSSIHDAVDFAAPAATLQIGTTYYLRVDTTASEKIYIHYDQASNYSPGSLVNKDGNEEGSTKDLLFEINGDYPVIPEPSTALLLGLGLAGWAHCRRSQTSKRA